MLAVTRYSNGFITRIHSSYPGQVEPSARYQTSETPGAAMESCEPHLPSGAEKYMARSAHTLAPLLTVMAVETSALGT